MSLQSALVVASILSLMFIGWLKHREESGHLSPLNISPQSGLGVATVDMDGDGDLDIVVAHPANLIFFENTGGGQLVDRGIIGDKRIDSQYGGIGIAITDIDGNGVLDIITASPEALRVQPNPVKQKK